MRPNPFFLAAAITIAAPPASASDALEAPTVVLDNDYAHVTEVLAGTGQRVALPAGTPAVIVSLSKARVGQQGGMVSDYGEGQIIWRGSANNVSQTVRAGTVHLFVVALKSPALRRGSGHDEVASDHSTRVDPDQHHMVLDNRHVRVIDGLAPAGGRSALHSHPPSVLVSLAKSRFRVTIDGKTRIFDFEPASVRWTNHFRHTWEIVAGQARVIMIELKGAADDPRFRNKQEKILEIQAQ